MNKYIEILEGLEGEPLEWALRYLMEKEEQAYEADRTKFFL